MTIILDIILVLLASYIAFKAGKRIFDNTTSSLMDYVIIVTYIFNAVPILMNLLFGLPMYGISSWYESFDVAANCELVNIVYDIFTISVFLFCHHYAIKYANATKAVGFQIYSSLVLKLLFIVSIMPLILAVLFGHYDSYLIFESASRRGLAGGQVSLLIASEILGLIAFHCWFFIGAKKDRSYLWLLLYDFLILWIDGKRYLMATIVILFVYFYYNSSYCITKKLNLKLIGAVLLPIFAAVYISYSFAYKIDENLAELGREMTYLNYRIDFGRDDVTKHVLYEELITKKPIIEYRGETILSTIFFWVPRSLWPAKPYPHYRYLTASIYGITIDDLNSGMTPSIFEMSIANFGVILGIIMTSVILIAITKYFDRKDSLLIKVFGLVILESLLTQSLDAIASVLIIWAFCTIFRINIGKGYRITQN